MLGFRASYYQGCLEIDCLKFPKLAHMQVNRLRQAVKPQTVFLKFDFSQQAAFKCFKLSTIHSTLKNRFLYALTDAFADVGDAAQAFATGGGSG